MRRATILISVVMSAVLQLISPAVAQVNDTGFDPSRKSPAMIPYNPDEVIKAVNAYVSGRVPTAVKGPVHGGTDINAMLGATRFYEEGFTGTNAVAANIEAGHIWNGHETLMHALQIPNNPAALNEYDAHATWVSAMIAGCDH